MTLRQLKPFIPSGPNFTKSKEFFSDLGFTIDWETQGVAQISMGSISFLLQDFHNKEMQENLMMFVSVENLEEWWRHVQSSGVLDKYEGVRAKQPTDYPWGQREVHLIDPAGVCWHFA
jgi:uncharacterized glyoxalase superfamily protein PhnB